MATISFDHSTAVVGSVFRVVPDCFGKATAVVRNRIARIDAERHLNTMSDRQLADIGIERADIHKVVWQAR